MKLTNKIKPFGGYLPSRDSRQIIVFGLHTTRYGVERMTTENCRRLVQKTRVEQVPVFVGFPLNKLFRHRDAFNHRAGELLELKLTKRGVNAIIQFTPEGLSAIESGKCFAADEGYFKHVGRRGNKSCWDIVGLKSIGLIREPCLPLEEIKIPK